MKAIYGKIDTVNVDASLPKLFPLMVVVPPLVETLEAFTMDESVCIPYNNNNH